MTGEFYFGDGLRPGAIVFFVAGLIAICWYYTTEQVYRKRRARLPESEKV
jgi:hypothetical protein